MEEHMIQSKVKLHGKHDDAAAGKDAKRRVVQQDKRSTMFCTLCSVGLELEYLMMKLGRYAIERLWRLAYFSRYAAISIERQPSFLITP